MKRSFKISTTLALSGMLFLAACKDDDDNSNPAPVVAPKLSIEIEHLAGTEQLVLGTEYVNDFGDPFTPTLFKYYISNVRLIRANGTSVKIPNSYFLVNQSQPATKLLEMDNLLEGSFTGMKFMIGIDSLHNVSGAQSGALDPANGMFWSWNTGYIFLKLEGTSPAVPGATHEFTYHIGGFQAPNANNIEITLDFDGEVLNLANNTHPEIHLVADLLQFFKDPVSIDLATFPATVTSPNASAATLATNYADMFRFDHIHAD